MPNTIALDLPLHLIQAVRLAHALAETGYRLAIAPDDRDKFSLLASRFGLDYGCELPLPPPLPGVALSHAEPRTVVGSIARPLIFPQAIVQACRQLWPDPAARSHWVVFAGLVTGDRQLFLQQWLATHELGRQDAYPTDNSVENLNLGRQDAYPTATIPKNLSQNFPVACGTGKMPVRTFLPRKMSASEVLIWSSDRGRSFPIKAWDEEYFRLLSQAEFVLCPSGDFVWTYRFFEAILCGAMPIVQEVCPLYEGFHFLTAEMPRAAWVRSPSAVAHNFQLACDRLTVPPAELAAEVARLLARP